MVEGIGRTVMGLADRTPLVDALGDTARTLLRRSQELDEPTMAVARAMARERIEAARQSRGGIFPGRC